MSSFYAILFLRNLLYLIDGKLCKGSISFSGFKYLERQNKYLCEEGFTGKGWDYVRRINGDSEEEIAKGETCNISGKESYVWNGVDYPNQDEYEAAKAEILIKVKRNQLIT